MDYGKEFEKFATKDQGINSNYYSKIIESMYPMIMQNHLMMLLNFHLVVMHLDGINILGKPGGQHLMNIL